MEKMIAQSYKIKYTDSDVADLYVDVDGEELFVAQIPNVYDKTSGEVSELAKALLKANDVEIRPIVIEPKPKRKYTKHIDLNLASEYGKIELKLAEASYSERAYYLLRYKPNGELVYKLDKKGIYTGKCKEANALKFTENDIKLIKNAKDFEFIKFKSRNANNLKNKITQDLY